MNVAFCDRCKKEIQRGDGELAKFHMLRIVSCSLAKHSSGRELTNALEADLCGDCTDELKKALAADGVPWRASRAVSA